ncbi:MAG: DNA topoisomerase 3 [Pleomorphochaeta sp.]
MKVVLAEKPSVARSLAKVLGCYKREDGYLASNEYIVTWALGHLVELAQPADYSKDYKRWSFASLPILPKDLKQVPIERTKDQFKVVKSLIERDDVDTFIIATDAGREGELVARWILELTKYNKSVKRLWISSQTDQAIKEGFSNLKEGDEYLDLYNAASSRAAADWYVGMNVTRALTTHYDAKISAGRVQTPTLYLICEREEEIEKFKGKFYWTIKGDFSYFNASFYPTNDSIRINNEAQKDRVVEVLKNNRNAKVVNVEKSEKVEMTPLAYDLTELQRDANLKLSFSAKKTLDVLQRLYEYHKIVTYPRTDSKYITQDIVPTLIDRLKVLQSTPFGTESNLLQKNGLNISERFVKDELVSDHHAIIPTEQRVNLDRLSEDERALWNLIVIRFLEVLSPNYIYDSTTIHLAINDYTFKTRTTKVKQLGFKSINRKEFIEDTNNILNEIKVNDQIKLVDYKVNKSITDTPKRYNDATLLSAMEHAGRYVEDSTLKKNLTAGLGTPATRADIIEKLIRNNYMIRNDNNEFVPTAYAREIIRLVPSLLKSPALTGEWEERLKKISKGKEDSKEFIYDIKELTRELVKNIKNSYESFVPNYKESKTCPYCNSLMMKVEDELNRTHFVCQKLSCSYEEMIVEKRVLLSEEEKQQQKKVVKKVKKVKVVAKENPSINKAAKVSSSAAYFQKLSTKVKVNETPIKTTSNKQYKIEKVVEVVRDSKLNRDKYRDNYKKSSNNFVDKKYKYDSSSSGGSFADFIKASENRHKKHRK